MMSRHYIRRDGNGGLSIGKGTLALLSLLLAVVCALAGFTFRAMAFQNTISNMQNDINDNSNDLQTLSPVVIKNHEDIAVISAKVENIDKNVEKILNKMEG